MWRYVVFVHCLLAWSEAKNGRSSAHQDHSGPGWDIRLAVPGEPGSDYPTLGSIPRTSFSCAGKEPGYYADLETNCQAFRVCTIGSTYGFQSFLCPNGTLFNQAVFVCDWWMNVNCQDSERLFNNNNEKFGNLRLGPQLMKDIKKMLTHPMRNPYDRNAMKGNLIVMQDYRPPYGQMFSNGALKLNLDTPLNNIYIPAKQVQSSGRNGYNNNNDIEFAASTPNPRYLPAAFNSFQYTTQNDAEVFQRQRQNGQYTQSNRQQNSQIRQQGTNSANAQFGQVISNKNRQYAQSAPTNHNLNTQNEYRQTNNGRSSSSRSNQVTNTLSTNGDQRAQINQQSSTYSSNQNLARVNNGKQAEFSIDYSKHMYNAKQEKQPYTYQQPQQQFSSEINSKSAFEANQNLVSRNNVPSTVIAKTLTLKRIIQDPKRGSPKSRITVKTWVVKPSKSAKLISPTPYTYDKPTEPTLAKLIVTTPYAYTYNKPTAQAEKIVRTTNQPYVYNKPQAQNRIVASSGPYEYKRPATQTQKIVSTTGPYTYNKPTTLARQQSKEPIRTFSTVTTPRPSLSRLYLTPTATTPTQSSRLYLPPTTYNPSSRLYLPPSAAPVMLLRQYLPPSNYQSEQLNASPTTPSLLYASPERASSKNNLTFTDILTKERLDNTVNNIVEDTSKILNTDQTQFEQFRNINSLDYPDESYLPPKSITDSGETLTSPPSTPVSKSSRLIASPSINLEPPVESLTSNKNSNQFSHLPFYMETLSPANTIERTVSLKISIPEKIASYLFKANMDNDLDKLEILNTGSSNYLVLTNNYANRQTSTNFIPIGKLISDKSSNFSNSQDLVFSLLADSINVAKGYNNAQVNTEQNTQTQSQVQSVSDEDITQITNKISDLTSSQFSGSQHQQKSGKIIASTQTPHHEHSTTTSHQQSTFTTSSNQYQTSFSETINNNANNVAKNSKQIFSGQLYQVPVPDVIEQVYNEETSVNNIKTSNSQNSKSSESEVEIVKSNNVPLSPAARLETAPTSEVDHFNSEENFNKFIKSNNGISAQIQDKIVGSIPHPLEDNKVVTYKKDESYYVYTKLDNTVEDEINSQKNIIQSSNAAGQQSAKLIQENNLPNIVAFQLIPSISYQLEDEQEQDNFLNSFQLDGYGQPKSKSNQISQFNKGILTTDVDYRVDHTLSNNQVSGQFKDVSKLYSGPSSYSAPQSSIGNLGSRQDYSSRLELDNKNNGYSKAVPSIQFTF